MGRAAVWLGSGLLLAGLLPLILPALASGLALLGGCEIGSADRIPPCRAVGLDVTDLVRIGMMAPWIFIATWPIAALGALLLAVSGLIALIRWARTRR
jgi:hypothetical protein